MAEFRWSPGIGDPTFAGWLTVVLYLMTAYWCWRAAAEVDTSGHATGTEGRVWRVIALAFVALGINKQLDLQSAFTEIGRMLAHYQGWYESRRTGQVAFIAFVAAVCLLAAVVLLVMVLDAPPATWLAAGGMVMVLMFVLVRAASFHHIDEFMGGRVIGLRWNWILEMGGVLLVLLAARRRRALIAAGS